MRDLTNLLGHSREADNPKHVSRVINILSSNSGDGDERGDKDWSDLITNAKDMKFPSFETMQRYFDKLETKDLKQLYKFLGVTTPKEEKEERAEMPLVMLNTTEASELRPENILARDILITTSLP